MYNLEPCREGHRRPYAWQVEVAACKLVMAANKMICKELGAGARCRLRKAAANQITALQYISEAVEVMSSERATTKMRTVLDTPALAGGATDD